MKRERFISMRVTPWELQLIEGKARRMRMSKSEYMRRAALDKPVIYIEGMDKVLSELGRIGNNINQLTVILRTRNIQQFGFEDVKDEFGKLILLVNKALEKGYLDGDTQDGERKVG